MFSGEIGVDISLFWKYHSRIHLTGNIFENWILIIENHWDSWLDDSSFFECYLFECIAKELHMVIGYTRDDRENRCDDIGRIESSPQPHFDDDIFASLLSKVEKRKEYTLLEV